MVSGTRKAIVFMVLMLLALPGVALAARVHNFSCNDCHRSMSSVTATTGNICLDCHQNPMAKTMADGSSATPQGKLVPADASNALQDNPGATAQTSHYWGTASDTNPQAGATPPTNTLFTAHQGYSAGTVACSRCHDPHGDKTLNPKLLRLSPDQINPDTSTNYIPNDMCLECHKDWNLSATHGIETHPMNVSLASAPGNIPDGQNDPADKYYDTPNNGATNGGVALVNGVVTCTTCHGAHWVDSDASTTDGNYGATVTTGDGRLLRHNGLAKEGTDASICQTCHKYTGHMAQNGTGIGCLVCHGGHDYDPNGNPNIYMLKKQITLDIDPNTGADISASPLTVNLDYTTYPPAADYNNGGGNGSLCLACHTLPSGHSTSWTCSSCHTHDNGTFSPGCGSCHGYAPSVGQPGNTFSGGYAVDTSTGNNYNLAGGTAGAAPYKDESATPHAVHANGGTGQYNFSCADCHGDGAGVLGSADHDAGSFQQVLDTAIDDGTPPALPGLTTSNGQLTPVYGNRAGAGDCSNVYCHSNGGPRGAVPTPAATAPVWENGQGTIIGKGTECQTCHGNDAGTMASRNDSALHQRHLGGTGSKFGKVYSCAVCHNKTATSNTALVSTAIGGIHVDGNKDVDGDLTVAGLSGSITYSAGTCSNVYCHSDGKGTYQTPNWDVQTGDCTVCHNDGTVFDPKAADAYKHAIPKGAGDPLDAHYKHVQDPNGPQLSCDVCHGAGATTGSQTGHINGTIDKPNQSLCDGCHGADGFLKPTTGDDREPIWSDATSVDCRTCHAGSVISTVQGVPAPNMNTFDSLGHGKSTLIAAPDCAGCHDTTGGKHFDATTGDPQLSGGVAANAAFCQTCHTSDVHYANTQTAGGTSDPGTDCLTCHDPHGAGMGTNSDAMLRGTIAGHTVNNFADRTARSSYWQADNTGVCQVCHDPAEVLHFNRTTQENATHNASNGVCINCHKHDTAPIFKPAADSCEACHATLMATAPHSSHINKNTFNTKIADDLSDCATCHAGADQYTVSGSANGNHQNGTVDVNPTVGYSTADQSCSGACHASSAADGSWADSNGLNCTACHNSNYVDGSGTPAQRLAGNTGVLADAAPANGSHSAHLTAGLTCIDCHGTVDAAGTHPLTHIDNFVSTALGTDPDGTILADMADAQPAEATVTDQAYNGGINSFNATNASCSNVDCHNPSSDGHSAQWGVSTASCVLCHNGDVASGSPMASGSHGKHVNNAALIGDNVSCVTCHGDTTTGGTNMAHRSGTVEFAAAPGWDGGLKTCSSATACHNDGYSPVASPVWGAVVDPATACQLCHEYPRTGGDHPGHWVQNRWNRGLQCATCHFGTVNTDTDSTDNITTIKAGGNHLNNNPNDVVASGAAIPFDGNPVTITYTQGAPSTCTATCHLTPTETKPWDHLTGCAACHGTLSTIGGAHSAHIDITGSIETDVTECEICHGADVATYTVTGGDGGSGNHQNGTVQLAAGISNTTCASACHASSATDGFWTDTNGLNCTACHNNGTNDGAIANAAPATGSHAKHIADGMSCSDCHTGVDAVGTHPLTHLSGLSATGAAPANQGEALTNKANPVADNATVDDSAFDNAGNTFDDVNNTCSNTYCHDPSDNNTTVTWGSSTASCELCHGGPSGATEMATGTHANHLNATATFGLTITCDKCHPNNTVNSHFVKTTTQTDPTTNSVVNQTVQFGGTVITGAQQTPQVDAMYSGDVALPNTTNPPATAFGTCGTTACHNNGQGGAPNNSSYTWGTTNIQNCLLCHNNMPTTGAHATHLDGNIKYGPYAKVGGSTNCGDCHAANASNTSMAGEPTHINGTITFGTAASPVEVAKGGIGTDTTVGVCDTCHGGTTAVNLPTTGAKAVWSAGGPVACESCHGDYAQANVNGALAPVRAGTAYDTAGHGKPGVGKACVDCHDHQGNHIGYTTKRLSTTPGGVSVDFAVDPNGFCNACHTTTMPVHYANTQTANGTSDDAILCITCHDQHGQNNGQAQMVASTIAGHSVTGFADKTVRGSYQNAAFSGVCQGCHDPAEVNHFNRNTDETTHNSGGNCIDCHKHNDTVAFKPSGCNGCHGGGTTGTVASNYWPDGTAYPNDGGEHLAHMDQLSYRVYGMSATALLNTVNADADQKALCAYCHNNPGTDATHNNGTVNTNGFLKIWDGTASTTTYTGGDNSCANSCHNGKATVSGTNSWYDGASSSCTMCHTVGAAGANPNTGLHNITAAGVQKHDDSLVPAKGCTECHTPPAPSQTSTHINGTFVAESGVNNDRFLNNTDFTYTEAPVNTSNCTSSCHSDGGSWARLWSTDANSTATTVGSARCNVCHGQLGNWRTGMTPDHSTTAAINNGTHGNCSTCHVRPNSPYAANTYHNTASPFPDANAVNTELTASGRSIEMNDTVGYSAASGNCTNICHTNDALHTLGTSSHFPANSLNGPGADCNTCHLATGGSNNTNTVGTYTFSGSTGAHGKHVLSAATAYGDTADNSTAANYDYGCGLCHPTNSAQHMDGTLEVTLDPTTAPGTIKANNDAAATYNGSTCSGVYCHSDGVNVAAGVSPDFSTGAFTNPNGDYCQNCHGNQPTTSSHAKHTVGIHYDDIYSGTSGVLPEANATGAGHGDVNTALTITCAVCHNNTVNTWYNGNNTTCVACHGSAGTATDKTVLTSADLDKSFHVNGTKDVAFAPVAPLRSKAQVRDFSATEPELNNNWQRIGTYKTGTGAHDETVAATPLDTATMWNGGTKNCTVACHNGNNITWGAASISCNACHTQLPK